MSYHRVSGIGIAQPLRSTFRETFGDALGEATYAGFPAANIAAYFGVSNLAAQGIIALANGKPLTPAQQGAVFALGEKRFRKGATGPNQGYGDITWGLAHLAQHPMGSHYSGGIGNVFKNIALNVATGGLYGITKAAIGVVKTGKILPGVKTAFATTGIAGNVLQPAVGTDKALAIEGAVAGAALAKVAASALTGPTSTVAQKAIPLATQTATQALTVPSGSDPRYNPGYESTPLDQQYNPNADAGFGPNLNQPMASAGLAEMFGGLSPIALGALIGVPLLIQFFMKKKK